MSGLYWGNILDCVGKDQKPRSTLSNAVAVLQHDPAWGPDTLYYDEFADRVMLANSPTREWRDDDDTRLTVYMQQTIGMVTIAETQVSSAVRYVARQRPRHCVRELIRRVPWDGIERIEYALEDFWGVEPSSTQPAPYVRAVSRNLFIGLIARIERPGCQLDTMAVLEGSQGIGKSKSLRILGGDYYMLAAESVASKDFYQSLPGKWLIEIGELDSFSRADRERTKIAISTPTDRYRASYGRRALDHPRQCVFVGTTNRDDYGQDDTGLRRILPVRCGDITCDALAVARPQLFAEALAKLERGATWWEYPDSALTVQRDRQSDDPWTATVLEWLDGRDETTSADILMNSPLRFRASDITRTEHNRIGSILRLTGEWHRQTIRQPDQNAKLKLPVKGWKRLVTDESDGHGDGSF